jgi:hypothetical protein
MHIILQKLNGVMMINMTEQRGKPAKNNLIIPTESKNWIRLS